MSYRVLVVDDSKLARMAMAKALNALHPDWNRIEASNGDEALALAKQFAVDMALLDFNMPAKDGLTLAAELRKLSPGMPLAVISANSQEEVIRRAQALGATFLSKPVSEGPLKDFLIAAARQLETISK